MNLCSILSDAVESRTDVQRVRSPHERHGIEKHGVSTLGRFLTSVLQEQLNVEAVNFFREGRFRVIDISQVTFRMLCADATVRYTEQDQERQDGKRRGDLL